MTGCPRRERALGEPAVFESSGMVGGFKYWNCESTNSFYYSYSGGRVVVFFFIKTVNH